MEDEQYAQRIKDTEGRQDSWLERRVIEGAEATENVSNPIKVDDDMNEPNNDKVTSDLQQAERQRAAHERGFDEDDFHKQVNNDFETRLAEIPDSDDDSMHGLLIGALRAHVAEVYSPPRVTARAARFGLNAGFAMDLQTNAIKSVLNI